MSDPLKDYWDALERLKKGRSVNVPQGTRITNDAVSLEAGRGRGSVKKSRPIFSDLIAAIETASDKKARPAEEAKAKYNRQRARADEKQRQWEEGLATILSLRQQVYELQKEVKRLDSSKVTPIRSSQPRQ